MANADLYLGMKGSGNFNAWDVFARGPMVVRFLALPLLVVLAVMSTGQGPAQVPNVTPATRQANNIAVITIKGEINQTTLRSVVRRLQLAERAGAEAIVFELDTPGGDLMAVIGICTAIKASPIKNSVAWINRDAYSGGAVIALACREIVVNDPSTLGDAIIINSMFGQINQMAESERQKFLAPLIAELVDSARRNGYDELLVQGIASRGVELWLVENKATGQRLCITRAEYLMLFGQEPPQVAPALASAPAIPDSEKTRTAQKDLGSQLDEFLKRSQRTGRRGPGQASKQTVPTNPDDPNRYVPAAPDMAPMFNDVTSAQELPTSRPDLTPSEAGKWTVIEYLSTGSGPFIFKADQMQRYGLAVGVVRNDEELKAHFNAKHLLRMDQTWSEGLVSILTWFPVRGLLVVIFLIALFVEMTHPGLVAPGGIAAAALIALIAPPLLINMASWWEIAAILSGIVLIALEIFVLPGFGFAGILGLLLLFGGLVGTFVPQGAYFPDSPRARNDLLYGLATMVMAVVTSGIGMYFIAKNFKSIPVFGKLVLKDPSRVEDGQDEMLAAMGPSASPIKKGVVGTALTPLRPAGRVELPGGRIIDAVADIGFIATGDKVRITSVSDFRIGVEKIEA